MAGKILTKIGVYIAEVIKADFTNIYVAWGTGDPAWDALPDNGESIVDVTDTSLFAENYRENAESIDFLDPADLIVGAATNRLEFNGRLDISENPVAIREFGIFGSASATPGSGKMIYREIFCLKDRSVSAPLDEFIIRISF